MALLYYTDPVKEYNHINIISQKTIYYYLSYTCIIVYATASCTVA